MGLLHDIIAEATDKSGDVPRLLRLCLVLAARLKNDALRAWAKQELEGYAYDAPLPPYRILHGRNQGRFVLHPDERTFDIPLSILPAEIQKYYRRVELRDSVSEYADLVSGTREKGGSDLQIPWPMEHAVHYGSELIRNAQCVKAWTAISPSGLAALLDHIKTRVLDFALEIEAEDPDAGDIPGVASKIQEDRVTQIFNTTIQGNVQNLANGSTNVSQATTTTINVAPGDLSGLLNTLRQSGIAEPQLKELQDAITLDAESQTTSSIGAKTKEWLCNLPARVGRTASDIGGQVLVDIATQALSQYFGSGG